MDEKGQYRRLESSSPLRAIYPTATTAQVPEKKGGQYECTKTLEAVADLNARLPSARTRIAHTCTGIELYYPFVRSFECAVGRHDESRRVLDGFCPVGTLS